MAKAKGIRTIKQKEPLRKLVSCSAEFDSGELYFDRTGRIVRSLAIRDTGWLRNGQVGLASTVLLNPRREMTLELTPARVSVALDIQKQPRVVEEDELDGFAREAQAVLSIVADELELDSFQRIGYREFYHFACGSLEESEQWIHSLGVVTVAESVYAKFGRQHYAMNWSVVLIGDECRYRIELRGVERSAAVPVGEADVNVRHSSAKHLKRPELLPLLSIKRDRATAPETYAVLDIDAFLWDVLEVDFEVEDFIRARSASNLNLFRECVPV